MSKGEIIMKYCPECADRLIVDEWGDLKCDSCDYIEYDGIISDPLQ